MREALLAGAALDLLIGDPQWMPHPVRAIGWWASRLEPRLRALFNGWLAGVIFWLLVVGPASALVWFSVMWLPPGRVSGALTIYWVYSLLAIRSLDRETMRAVAALASGDLHAARQAISMVVGRDTAALDEAGILRAAIETIAENLSDAIVAPLFYFAIAGPPAMAAYKAINTLDSMVGYKNDRYRDFGWFSARADDWANWIPARLTAVLISICGLRFRTSISVAWRDARSQPSPNSGWPEAAMAGALGVRLGGVSHYQGRESVKAVLGDDIQPLSFSAYRKARIVLYAVSGASIALAWSVCR
ncbi:MAG: adenosylcobinamide-phosphate synthase CbiB [Bryobacteraceae bacterium]